MACLTDDVLLRFAEGALTPDEAVEARAHAQTCADCRLLVWAADGANGQVDGDLIGRTVGNFRVVSRLGAGGMGAVFTAVNDAVGRHAAVKVMHGLIGSVSRARFLIEARALAQLSHPHIVQIYDYGRLPDDTPYLLMERLEGETLAARLGRGPLPFAEAVELGSQLGEALTACHARGIVHRDLKPQNIFLCSQPGGTALVAKLLDFGLAKFTEGDSGEAALGVATASGVLVGTPLYMAPERFSGGAAASPAFDQFSLAAVIYEALAGKVPYPADNLAELIEAHRRETPAPLARAGRDVPVRADAALRRALARDPEARFATVADLVVALRNSGSSSRVVSRAGRVAFVCAALAAITLAGQFFGRLRTDSAPTATTPPGSMKGRAVRTSAVDAAPIPDAERVRAPADTTTPARTRRRVRETPRSRTSVDEIPERI